MINLIDELYVLKTNAIEHIKSHRYHSAAIYLQDALRKFQQVLEQPQEESTLETIIRDIKISSHKNLSLCYLKLKKYAQCIEECNNVLEVEPNNVKFIYRIGKAHLQLQNYGEAEGYFKRGFHLDPHEKQIMKQLQGLQKHRKETNSVDRTKEPLWLCQLKALIVFLIMIVPLLGMRFAKKLVNSLGLESCSEAKKQ